MSVFTEVMSKCSEILNYTFHWDTFTFTLWDVFLGTLFLGLTGYCLGKVIHLERG